MQAYTDGDIVLVIKKALLSSNKVFEEFSKLCDNEYCASYGEEDIRNMMRYMMMRFANMRETFFSKHLKTNRSGNLVAKMANNQSTTARVVNAVSSSKAAGDATKDAETKDAKTRELWQQAANNVCEYADKEEDEEMKDFFDATDE